MIFPWISKYHVFVINNHGEVNCADETNPRTVKIKVERLGGVVATVDGSPDLGIILDGKPVYLNLCELCYADLVGSLLDKINGGNDV